MKVRPGLRHGATEAAGRHCDRRTQVGTGDRAEKIRTYHFKDNRITDHRAGFTTHRLNEVLNGDLLELLDNVHVYFQAKKLDEATGDQGEQ